MQTFFVYPTRHYSGSALWCFPTPSSFSWESLKMLLSWGHLNVDMRMPPTLPPPSSFSCRRLWKWRCLNSALHNPPPLKEVCKCCCHVLTCRHSNMDIRMSPIVPREPSPFNFLCKSCNRCCHANIQICLWGCCQ